MLDGQQLVITVLTCLAIAVPSLAQDGTADSAETSNAAAAIADSSTDESQPQATQAGPARAEYETALSQWKQLLKEMRDLQFNFRIAEESDVDELRDQFADKQNQGEKQVDRIQETGLRVFAEAPDQDIELTRFLVTLTNDDIDRDKFERAYQTAKVLIDHDTIEKSILDTGAIAAFAIQEFDVAKSWIDQAAAAGVLDLAKEHMSYLDEIPAMWAEEQRLRAAEAEADDLPRVKLQTSQGEIVVELFENEAPGTVGNFVHLVESGFYDGMAFHRVLPGFMAQAGCPRGDGTGGPGYNIYCECFQDNHRKHFRGSLSMAKQAPPNTGGSQFYLTFLPTPHLNGKHTVFGRVVEGLDVLSHLQRRNPNDPQQARQSPDHIVKATVVRKRDHAYVPDKVEP